MSAKKPRTAKAGKVDLPPYDYGKPGAQTYQQRQERLEGLIQVFVDIFASLSPEDRVRYMTEPREQEDA
jgi:hypothetical protein